MCVLPLDVIPCRQKSGSPIEFCSEEWPQHFQKIFKYLFVDTYMYHDWIFTGGFGGQANGLVLKKAKCHYLNKWWQKEQLSLMMCNFSSRPTPYPATYTTDCEHNSQYNNLAQDCSNSIANPLELLSHRYVNKIDADEMGASCIIHSILCVNGASCARTNKRRVMKSQG